MNEQIDINELGKRIKRRDEEAFRVVYVEYFSKLQHYAMRYLYDWDESENRVQDAFFTLWSNLDKYDEKRNVVAYLLTIVKNACLKYIRSLKIHDNNQDKMIEAMLFSDLPNEEPDENLQRRLNQILAQLPEKQKEVLLKHAVEHKTLPSIAKELDIAESTAKTHYKRAIALLRKNLQFIIFGF